MDPIIIYTDDGTDERNARPLVASHTGIRPGPTPAAYNRPPVRPPVVIYPNAPTAQVGQVAQVAPVAVPGPALTWQPGVGWVQSNPAMAGQVPSPMGSKLGQLATPALIQGVAMLLASFLPVPPAPTATGDVEDDVANGITYQAALAAHAKTDEKIRAAGFLLAQFL